MANEKQLKTQIKIGPARGSYANIFKPRAISEGDEPKYSISLLFPKDAKKGTPEANSIELLKRTCEAVAEQKFGPDWRKIKKFHMPLRDGDVDKPEHKEYAGMIFCNASSKRQPGVVDRHLVTITDEKEAYSGCYFVAAVNVYAFERKGNKGVALGLNNLLVWAKGEKLAGGKEAAEDFAEFADGNGNGDDAGSSDDENPLD